jgi:hypothetical protein
LVHAAGIPTPSTSSGRALAKTAQEWASQFSGGIGDKGRKSAYIGTAKSISVGGLDFEDCTVEVLENRSVVGEEGLIGADVFEDFLVDIDFPHEKLRLSELPKRGRHRPSARLA